MASVACTEHRPLLVISCPVLACLKVCSGYGSCLWLSAQAKLASHLLAVQVLLQCAPGQRCLAGHHHRAYGNEKLVKAVTIH